VWSFFPFIWLLCEGHNSLSVDAETIAYSMLDIIAKPIFGVLLLYGHRDIDPALLGFTVCNYHSLLLPGVLVEEDYAAIVLVAMPAAPSVVPAVVTVVVPEGVPEAVSEKKTEDAPEDVSEGTEEKVPENIAQNSPRGRNNRHNRHSRSRRSSRG
jgi:Bacteriorhodopsin-like protein